MKTIQKILIIYILHLFCTPQSIIAQDTLLLGNPQNSEKSLDEVADSLSSDTLIVTKSPRKRNREKATVIDISNDSLPVSIVQKPNRIGDPMKASMMSAVFPGGGQIYNRKFWKLPIIYGGFGALFYSISSNSKNYQLYYKGYMDFTDDIKETDSYLPIVPADPTTYDPVLFPDSYNPANAALVEEKMLRLVDYHKRYRDLSAILTGVLYFVQILDANVDASLMGYDVSDNLELSFYPSLINIPGGAPGTAINMHLTMAF